LGLGKGLVLIALLLAGPVTALASAAYRVGIPQSAPLRDDLAQVVEQSYPSVEENLG
jgi:multisubunit Na+/H+ antiporter MnhG subunit